MDKRTNQMKLYAAALAAGVFIWANGAMADETLAKDESLSLGPAVSTDELKAESGMIDIGAIGIADAEQNADQKVLNVIKSDAGLDINSGNVTVDPNAINTNTMTIIANNSGHNVVMNNQLLINMTIINGEESP